MKKLIPSNTKYKKYHKGKKYNRVFKHNQLKVLIGSVGLKFKIGGRITSKQINSTQLLIQRCFHRLSNNIF